MSVKSLFAAIAFILLACGFAFSLWAEWGPYSWLITAQMALMDSYSGKLCFFLTFILFLIPSMIVLTVFVAGDRIGKALALGVPALLILAHFGATVFFLSTGGTQIESSDFAASIRQAGFAPQNITLERSQLPALDSQHTYAIKESYAPDDSAEIYVPFVATSWPSPGTRVVFKSTPAGVKAIAESGSLKGVLKKAPLPSLVRRAWLPDPSIFAIIIEEKATVRGLWFPAAFLYVLAAFSIIVGLIKSKRAKSALLPAAS